MDDSSLASTRLTCHDGHAIGLDLGATAVRAAVLAVRQRDGQPVVEARDIAGAPLMPGIVVDGAVRNGPALTAALKTLWKTHRIKCRNVVLGVASPQALVRDLAMPDLPPSEIAKALPFQAKELVAMPLEQMVLDYAPLGVAADGEPGMQQGLLVATPRGPVLEAVAAVEAAGLKVVRIDLSSLALLRSVADGRFAVEAVVDLGAHLTTIVIHQGGVPRLVRTLPRGGDQVTQRLADHLGVDVAEAEDAKRRSGLTAGDDTSVALRELVAPLLAEIRSSVNYFRTSHASVPIERVLLTGGASALRGLPELLSDQIGVTCERSDSASRLVPPLKAKTAVDAEWASALSIGLAIGAAA